MRIKDSNQNSESTFQNSLKALLSTFSSVQYCFNLSAKHSLDSQNGQGLNIRLLPIVGSDKLLGCKDFANFDLRRQCGPQMDKVTLTS